MDGRIVLLIWFLAAVALVLATTRNEPGFECELNDPDVP